MLIQIITHTPVWVWAILVLLLWVGIKQTLPRSVSLQRITVLPFAMVGLSLAGTLTAFGAGVYALLAWCAAAAVTSAVALVAVRGLPQRTHYSASTKRFDLPGSWTPMVLMMGIFITKYAVGVTLAMQPELARNALFIQGVSALYGGFSGVFIARSAPLWRLAFDQSTHTTIAQGA
jgi:hypothetical protein